MYPNGRPPCPFIYEYIYESGGGANWTPLHEFSCVPWFRQSPLLVILRAKSQLRKYERTEIRILVSVVYCTRFQWQLGQGNLIVLYRKHHSNQRERERQREPPTDPASSIVLLSSYSLIKPSSRERSRDFSEIVNIYVLFWMCVCM